MGRMGLMGLIAFGGGGALGGGLFGGGGGALALGGVAQDYAQGVEVALEIGEGDLVALLDVLEEGLGFHLELAGFYFQAAALIVAGGELLAQDAELASGLLGGGGDG